MRIRKQILFSVIFIALSGFFVLSPVAGADSLYQQVRFNVNSDFDKLKRNNLTATLRHIGGKAYFYVDDSYWNRLSDPQRNSLTANIKLLGDEYDNNIHPKETDFWGSEPDPGIDGDSRITILLEELIDMNGGYFDTSNGYSVDLVNDSNQREMIALNAEVLMADLALSKVFLAHEFQHLISFNQKEKLNYISEEVWLNEMRSEYSVSVVGYNDNYHNSNLARRVYIFNQQQDDSLTEWPNKNLDYAMAALFAEYLAEQYGGSILSETLKGPFAGMAGLNRFLADRGYYDNFGDIFLNWAGALYLNDAARNSKLGYRRPELMNIRATPKQKISLSGNLGEYNSLHYIKDWQPLWLEYDVGVFSGSTDKAVRVDLSGEPGQSFISSYLALYDSGEVKIGKINYSGSSASALIRNPGGLNKVILLATKSTKTYGFGKSEVPNYISAKVSVVDSKGAGLGELKDGSLIKRPREKEIYVIWGKYKRYLNPEVISLYGHLDPAEAIELESEAFDSYQTSNYVKYVSDEKVYAVWPDGTKHWLNITPHQWDSSHRDWNAIFTINELELNHYIYGADIIR